jgi:biotin synthase
MKTFIEELKNRVLSGGEVTFEEAMRLVEIEITDKENVEALLEAAREITFQLNTDEPGLCSLINAKSNLCGEDCGFCSQSVRFDTRVNQYQLMSSDEVVAAAKNFEKKGAVNFCVVTSGGALNEKEFDQIIEIYKRLKAETNMSLDGSLGFLTAERVERLKEAGLRRFNNNLQSSREFYPKIVTTHSFDKRLETMDMLRDGNVEICSGGILGMGETREDRVKLAFELKPYAPHCLPMNILNPRPGTPLENVPQPDPMEMVKTIAVYRFIHPKANIKLAGGREVNLGSVYQEASLKGGANGLIIGGYLTTEGNPIKADFEMLKRAGFKPKKNPKAEELPETVSAASCDKNK